MAKRLFDICFAIIGLLLTAGITFILFVVVSIDTKQNGMFTQMRVGQHGKLFKIYKIRSIKHVVNGIYITTPLGRFLRKYKIDEFPQFYNILIGNMSFVGPRPDIPGYFDKLKGDDLQLLQLKPGLTGPASLKYTNEDELLAGIKDPLKYNDEILFPDKVRINLNYQKNRTLWLDFKIIFYTLLGKRPTEKYLQ